MDIPQDAWQIAVVEEEQNSLGQSKFKYETVTVNEAKENEIRGWQELCSSCSKK